MAQTFRSIAKVLGLESEIGCLVPDARADFLWMKNDLEIEKVWVGGKEQWIKDK